MEDFPVFLAGPCHAGKGRNNLLCIYMLIIYLFTLIFLWSPDFIEVK